MDAAYAIPIVLALVAGFFVVRHIANRQRRLLDQYRKHRTRRSLTGSPRTQSPDTKSPRSDMRAFEHPSSVIDATTTSRDDRMNPPAPATDTTTKK